MIDHTGRKILVVEDEVPMARAIQDRLRADGFKVTVAVNGEEGLKLVKSEAFDMVLLDIAMPKVSGLEMLQKMREAGAGSSTPIIIYTNLIPDDVILKDVARDKPTYYLSKTEHSIDYVIQMIDKTLAGTSD